MHGYKLAKFNGNILSLSENTVESLRGLPLYIENIISVIALSLLVTRVNWGHLFLIKYVVLFRKLLFAYRHLIFIIMGHSFYATGTIRTVTECKLFHRHCISPRVRLIIC